MIQVQKVKGAWNKIQFNDLLCNFLLYKNVRNVRFVLFTKTSIVANAGYPR